MGIKVLQFVECGLGRVSGKSNFCGSGRVQIFEKWNFWFQVGYECPGMDISVPVHLYIAGPYLFTGSKVITYMERNYDLLTTTILTVCPKKRILFSIVTTTEIEACLLYLNN